MYYMHMYYSTDPGMVIKFNLKVLALSESALALSM